MHGPSTQISRKFRANIIGNASHKLCEHTMSSHTSTYTIYSTYHHCMRAQPTMRLLSRSIAPAWRGWSSVRPSWRRASTCSYNHLRRGRQSSPSSLPGLPTGRSDSVTYQSDKNEIRNFRQLHLRPGSTQISRALRAICLSPNFGKHCAKLCLAQGKQ